MRRRVLVIASGIAGGIGVEGGFVRDMLVRRESKWVNKAGSMMVSGKKARSDIIERGEVTSSFVSKGERRF